MNKTEIAGVILSSLFVAGEAVETEVFSRFSDDENDDIDVIVQELISDLEMRESGLLVKRIGNKIQLCTNRKYAETIKELFVPTVSETLSKSVMETLSVIAYRQPVTRSEISDVRGVNSNYAVSALMEMDLIKEVGRKNVLGRPALLATTDEFLRHFGMNSLDDLPVLDVDDPAENDPVDELMLTEEVL